MHLQPWFIVLCILTPQAPYTLITLLTTAILKIPQAPDLELQLSATQEAEGLGSHIQDLSEL